MLIKSSEELLPLEEICSDQKEFMLELADTVLDNILRDNEEMEQGVLVGSSILATQVSAARGSAQSVERANEFLDRLLDKLCSNTHRRLGLFGGIAGYSWAVAWHAKQDERVAHEVDDLLNQVDELLVTALSQPDWNEHYDLISGLVGIGVYGLVRGKTGLGSLVVERVISQLERWAEKTDGVAKWRTPARLLPHEHDRSRYQQGEHNLGVAHGIPGVVGLLANVCHVSPSEANRLLLRQAVDYLLSVETSDCESAYSYNAEEPKESRLAWCYGDPGVAYCLLQAAIALRDSALKDRAIAILVKCADRGARDQGGVVDAGLCHGSAGLMLIFERAHQITKLERFSEAARYWRERTLNFRYSPAGLGAFPRHDNREGQSIKDNNFLTGSTGVAVALLDAAGLGLPGWDAPLLLNRLDF
jgi:lantibiotic modifying enzyme